MKHTLIGKIGKIRAYQKNEKSLSEVVEISGEDNEGWSGVFVENEKGYKGTICLGPINKHSYSKEN